MKPSDKQLKTVKAKIAYAYGEKGLTNAQLGRIASVHPSQVGRICAGNFRTFSHNVVQICKALGVQLPRVEASSDVEDPAWSQAKSSMRRIWDETPDGARAIAKMLDAVADLRAASADQLTKSQETS